MSNQKSHHLRNEYPLCKITVRMIPAAQEVHSTLGPGCMEIFYQRALALELPAHDLDFSREVRIDVFNTGQNPGEKREDFIIEDAMVEKKARVRSEDVDFIQALSYLKASGFQVGLLFNFGARLLEIKRLIYT